MARNGVLERDRKQQGDIAKRQFRQCLRSDGSFSTLAVSNKFQQHDVISMCDQDSADFLFKKIIQTWITS